MTSARAPDLPEVAFWPFRSLNKTTALGAVNGINYWYRLFEFTVSPPNPRPGVFCLFWGVASTSSFMATSHVSTLISTQSIAGDKARPIDSTDRKVPSHTMLRKWKAPLSLKTTRKTTHLIRFMATFSSGGEHVIEILKWRTILRILKY